MEASPGNPTRPSQRNTRPSPGDDQWEDQHLEHPHQELSRELEVTNFLKTQWELGLEQTIWTSQLFYNLQSTISPIFSRLNTWTAESMEKTRALEPNRLGFES